MTRRSLLRAAVVLLGLGAGGCGRVAVTGGASARTGARTATPDQTERYRDSDDSTVRGYGHGANTADSHGVAALVKRYYAAAAAGDGAATCGLTSPTFARTVPEDYAQELGPTGPTDLRALVRGATTCAAVLSRLLVYEHSQLAAAITVSGVRVAGDYGYALVGSPTLPASFIEVAREGHAWKVDGLLGRPVP